MILGFVALRACKKITLHYEVNDLRYIWKIVLSKRRRNSGLFEALRKQASNKGMGLLEGIVKIKRGTSIEL